MRKQILTAIFLILTAFLHAQSNYQSEFAALIQNDKMTEAEALLKKWEAEFPDNTEMLIGYFNYYLNRNLTSTPTMGQMQDGTYGLYDKKNFDIADTKKGISYLDIALKKAPNRLDIYFGKTTTLLQIEDYNLAAQNVLSMLNRSASNKNKWLWTNDLPIEANVGPGETILFYGINDYVSDLFYSFDQNKENIKKIVDLEVKLYPKNVWGLNHAARYYSEADNLPKVIELLTRAVELDPNDYIVIGNLAYSYEKQKDYNNALKYYNMMLTMDDDDSKAYAEEGIARIKAQNR